ncbi:MAG TPA: ester cyclase [Pyrinomonadaceae bacterium]|nr:ester cyclase [Pyrinomonadaceae bacterium]
MTRESVEDPKAIIRRWFEEVWNKGREEAIDELFAEDGVAYGLADGTGAPLRGASGFKPFFRNFRGAFPDIEVVVEDTIAEGDRVAARCTVRATHAGDQLGFAATQKPIQITGVAIVRIRDGKIVEAWNNFDFMSMFQQLGTLQK